ncbi:hypothetical protein M9991_11840 [Chryseobacterium gallinarum]|uniref:hypothetical protein n=1 Tax=Chryseobacterium gallinarum TaxID=1324352 RepID=UPI0020250FA2|nr:hypothetical protein [Chryseobacterium gallinarum]MCL8537555.1 hypothetical protein [Chryseobacterium gallinarum]
MKFGIIFYAILGILALFIGIYLLQYFILLSIIFFIGAFINVVFIHKEYSLHKNDKIKYDENSIPDEVIVKYSPEINYLYFFHNDEKIEINIDDLDITDYQLSQVLKIFRVRFNNSGII